MTKQEQYVFFLRQIQKALDVDHDLSVIADDCAVLSFWNQREQIHWSKKHGDSDSWNLLDETVMVIDAIPSYGYPLLLSKEQTRRIGMFFLNLPAAQMKPGTFRRWQDRCDWFNKQYKFYQHELAFASVLRKEHERFLLAASCKESLQCIST